MWQHFRAWGRANPFSLSLATATGKTAAADAMTQRYIEGKPALDRRRLALFTVFGFGYLGVVQYVLYVRCFAAWFPAATRFGEHPTLAARLTDRAGLRDLLLQTCAGNFVHIPFAFFPAFYVTQEMVSHGSAACTRMSKRRHRGATARALASWDEGPGLLRALRRVPPLLDPSEGLPCDCSRLSTRRASRALQRYRENMWADLVAAWQIWIPGHLIFFSTPLWARLPTNHAMSFGFCCVLSFMRGNSE